MAENASDLGYVGRSGVSGAAFERARAKWRVDELFPALTDLENLSRELARIQSELAGLEVGDSEKRAQLESRLTLLKEREASLRKFLSFYSVGMIPQGWTPSSGGFELK